MNDATVTPSGVGDDAAPQLPNLNELRQAANSRFAAGALDEALPMYSLAVDVARKEYEAAQSSSNHNGTANDNGTTDPELVIHLCNRSACFYRMEMYEEARDDAAEAAALGSNSKAFFRLARSQMALADYTSAIDTIHKAIKYLEDQLKNNQTTDDYDDESNKQLLLQKQEFEKLISLANRKQTESNNNNNNPSSISSTPQDEIKSIKLEPRTPSIREFILPSKSSDTYRPLGEGNFSTVVICQHKVTKETFALKIIEKEACKKLAKRQHPNVHNEVFMERRILTQGRLPRHVNVIQCYHAMQDYGNLYFLMDLHQEHGDLWSQIRYQKCMVGCHSSLIRTYAYELLAALEHCHEHGIVHRDIKPENVLLSQRGGHVVLIDFGTAKDLVYTDLNGPEFVGTPDFMSPEGVREFDKSGHGCDFTADLWALGVLIYQLYAGALPFEAASPYMTFLKIQRGVFGRNMGVWDNDAWDLIQKLLKVAPQDRLGAGCFEWSPPPKIEEGGDAMKECGDEKSNKEEKSSKQKALGKVISHGKGYDIVRQHPFFAKHHSLANKTNSLLSVGGDNHEVPQPIPSLRDLALRATAHFIDESSLDMDLEDQHPPGDTSSYDALRLKPSDRTCVMHILDRLRLLKEPRIYRRFFHSKQEARLGRVRPESRDVIGLTQKNDEMGHFPGRGEEETHPDQRISATTNNGDMKICIHHVTNPLFSKSINDECSKEENEPQRKEYIKQLKESIRLVNRLRPKAVIACGYFDDTCRKILSKVNESVPVILHDGTAFFNFWVHGAHCVAMRLNDFVGGDGVGSDEDHSSESRKEAMEWFRMELEQIKTARSHGYLFVDGDPRQIPAEWIAKIGRSHVLGILGLCKDDDRDTFEEQFVVAEKESDNKQKIYQDQDDKSCSSSESENENAPTDEHVMHIVGRLDSGVRCVTVREEELKWDTELLL
mmetsp:Transcript_10157/g.22446  ORF Transcript_10157/g.22446 Transcript_10157/m.22446 type:complete len:944 (+) Transcript_10157:2-2833(+)